MDKEADSTEWDHLKREVNRYPDFNYPKVTVVIPTYNSDKHIARTLDSVLDQNYSNLEVLVIDAGSTDRTLKIVWESYSGKIRLSSVTSHAVYEMMNRAVSLAKGEYLNFLFSGDQYIQSDTVRDVMTLAIDHSKPDLVYGGSLLRIRKKEPRFLFRSLHLEKLRRGLAPTALPACWFHRDIFSKVGFFNTNYLMRANLDYLVRVAKNPAIQVVATSKAYIDHEVREITPNRVFLHFRETFHIVFHQFGWMSALRWLFYQKDVMRLMHMIPPKLKLFLFGKTEINR